MYENRSAIFLPMTDGIFTVQRPEHVRITDFGLAKLLSNKQGTMFSTTGEKVVSHFTLLNGFNTHRHPFNGPFPGLLR